LATVRSYQPFINGEFIRMESSETITVRNPATEEIISEIPECTLNEVNRAIEAAEKAQKSWEKLPAIQRAQYLRKIAKEIRENADFFARIITEEQGKILSLAKKEVNAAADYLDYNAEWARRLEGEILHSDRPNENIFMFKHPIGVVAAILPWNFPFSLIARKIAPALIAGNTVVIKPSEETPNNAFEFAKLVAETNLPKGVFNLVSGRGETVGNALASSPKVGMISFTGSVDTGSKIMRAAAKNITKVSLELGGKAPAIVMDDANIELAVESIRVSRIINSGQACVCAERVYVHEKIADEFIEKLCGAMSRTKVGDSLVEPDVEMGPLTNKEVLMKVDGLVTKAVQEGAEVITGGKRANRDKGFFYEPTVLINAQHHMEIMKKEIFGPVLPVTKFRDLNEAIEMANDSDYGLSSSIYTQSLDVAMRACRELKFGETFINRENIEALHGFHAGWRRSGIGGDDGRHGLEEYLQTHMVYIQYDHEKK
jgi:NAD-dependent aldehyde dehydrogenases